MPDFACRTSGAPKDLLVEDKPRSDSAAHLDKSQIFFASPRSEYPLTQSPEICIII